MYSSFDSQTLVEETEKSEESQGWLATFADLMSLLMCFFVLLLSFSELDVMKFKQLSGSMKTAFGVQRDVEADAIPKGTSAVLQNFSPALTEPTLLDQVRQETFETENPELSKEHGGEQEEGGSDLTNTRHKRLEAKLAQVLSDELKSGQFELDHLGQQLIIRINESGAFASGSGYLQPMFNPVLEKVATLLSAVPGDVIVSGHTDNLPVHNEMFKDNLGLSAARAIAVSRVLMRHPKMRNVKAQGMASSQPLMPNDSAINRAKNRRVEISILQGKPKQTYLSTQEINRG